MDKDRTVALVDDDQAILLVLGDRLEMEGYRVIRARSGEEALEKIKSDPPHLVILDIAMPGIGGMGFLKRLGDQGGAVRFPILVFTARAELKGFFSDVSVDAFLPKTATPEQLIGTVRELLCKATPAMPAMDAGAAGDCTVMLVDDDPETRRHLTRFFARHGLRVCEAPSPHGVVELAQTHNPHVVLLKFFLPHHNGPALATQLRQHPPTRHIPVVLYDDSAVHLAGQTFAHVDAFVPTGTDEHLLKAVNTVLRR